MVFRSSKAAASGDGNEPLRGNSMKVAKNLKLIGITTLLTVGLAACDQPGPAETAGKKLDQTASKVGEKMGEAADKVGDQLGAQRAKAGVAIDDTEITAKVKAAIFAEPGLKTLQISVDTVNGIVTISGSVDSQSVSNRAKELASAVAGVTDVENRLVVKSNK
jgi:hyperosmotically inducible protein